MPRDFSKSPDCSFERVYQREIKARWKKYLVTCNFTWIRNVNGDSTSIWNHSTLGKWNAIQLCVCDNTPCPRSCHPLYTEIRSVPQRGSLNGTSLTEKVVVLVTKGTYNKNISDGHFDSKLLQTTNSVFYLPACQPACLPGCFPASVCPSGACLPVCVPDCLPSSGCLPHACLPALLFVYLWLPVRQHGCLPAKDTLFPIASVIQVQKYSELLIHPTYIALIRG